MSDIEDEIPLLIMELLRDRIGVDVEDSHTDLIESGMLDSLRLVMLIATIQEAFLCEVPLDDFDADCFRSVDRIVEFLWVSSILTARDT
jgi:acyl carrier protein